MEELAEQLHIGFTCDVGAPMPAFLQTDYGAFLLFYISQETSETHGRSVNIRSTAVDRGVAVIQFKWCVAFMWGPGEDKLHTHRLWGKGLGHYAAFMVHNSRWSHALSRLSELNEHQLVRRDWGVFNHYIFTFHDGSFEIVAQDLKISNFDLSMDEIIRRILDLSFYDASFYD